VFALLLGGLVYLLARRHVGERLGWGAAVALYATPMVGVLAGWAYNDLALAFYQVAALYAALNGLERRSPRWFAVGGAMAGLALGLKYTAFVCPLTLIGLVAWEALRKRIAVREALGYAAWLGGTALALAAPWYARNWAFVGNPVHPFAFGLFGGQGWSAWHAGWYARAGTGLGGDVGAILALPLTLTLGLRDMNYYDGRTGPLFLAALPALLLVAAFDRRKPRRLSGLLFFSLAQYVAWVAGVAGSRSLFQSRLLLAGLVSLCPALAYVHDALRRLDRPRLSVHRFVGLAVVLVLVLGVLYQGLDVVRLRPFPYLVGEESRDGFLMRRLGAHYAAMQAVAELPEEAHVQFLWEPRSYHAGRVVQPDPILESWSYLCHVHECDVDAIAADLLSQGVTHILLHRAGMENIAREAPEQLRAAEVAAWDGMRQGWLQVEWEIEGVYVLYGWRYNR
jgi:hypothetical protein